MTNATLDAKLDRIRKGSDEFLICDAKDGDMGGGVVYTGPKLDAHGRPAGRWKTRQEHLDQVRALVRQGVVDMMLLSLQNLELLVREGLFEGSKVGMSARANDATDIWSQRHGRYKSQASRPFNTSVIPHMMHGRLDVKPGTPASLTDLGLYSATFTNDVERDRESLEAYREFRLECERWGFRHFFEVFNPNVGSENLDRAEVGAFVNDCIAKTLAGVPQIARPQFLKIAYNGPKVLEELASFDPSIVVGILGGGAGTTRDTLELLFQAKKYGGKLVLFGRKINGAEDPLALVALMRRVVEGEVGTEEAVRLYHDGLKRSSIPPARPLEKDVEITEEVLRG